MLMSLSGICAKVSYNIELFTYIIEGVFAIVEGSNQNNLVKTSSSKIVGMVATIQCIASWLKPFNS